MNDLDHVADESPRRMHPGSEESDLCEPYCLIVAGSPSHSNARVRTGTDRHQTIAGPPISPLTGRIGNSRAT